MRELQILENENPFYAPFAHSELIKAEEESGKWVIYLEASNEAIDLDGEVTVMKALKEAADHYLTHGVISWDHQHKIQKDPSYIIGEPMDLAFTSQKSTLVKAMLYKENKRAQGVWENIQSNTSRFGSSIGGYILKKAVEATAKFIKQVLWDETAITHKPVNDTTMGKVQLLPFTAFAKALMAGSGVNAANFSGGRALTTESLQGTEKNNNSSSNIHLNNIPIGVLDLVFKGFLENVKEGSVKSYEDTRKFVMSHGFDMGVTDQMLDFIYKKIKSR